MAALKRLTAGAIGLAAPPASAALVLAAEASTPQYSAVTFTISRLAAQGMPEALPIELAILTAAAACFALAAVEPRSRWALVAGGVALVLAALFRYDPSSVRMTLVHRAFTAIAVVALVVAPLVHGRRLGRAIAAGELALLAPAPALLATSFDAWGLWERCLLALPLAWMTATSFQCLRATRTRVSSEEMPSAALAASSSNCSYDPVHKVNSANP